MFDFLRFPTVVASKISYTLPDMTVEEIVQFSIAISDNLCIKSELSSVQYKIAILNKCIIRFKIVGFITTLLSLRPDMESWIYTILEEPERYSQPLNDADTFLSRFHITPVLSDGGNSPALYEFKMTVCDAVLGEGVLLFLLNILPLRGTMVYYNEVTSTLAELCARGNIKIGIAGGYRSEMPEYDKPISSPHTNILRYGGK